MRVALRKRSLSGRARSEINVTPLIDVLLVLIVIFMVITPMTPEGFRADVPAPAGSRRVETPPDTLVLSLDADGQIRLNQETLDFAALFARLQELFRTRSDRTVFVQADGDILFNEVARMIDTARGAGADRIGLMTEPVTLP